MPCILELPLAIHIYGAIPGIDKFATSMRTSFLVRPLLRVCDPGHLYAKYSLYAKQAQRNGNVELATLFTKTANTERFQHFAEEAQLAGLLGSDADNLAR